VSRDPSRLRFGRRSARHRLSHTGQPLTLSDGGLGIEGSGFGAHQIHEVPPIDPGEGVIGQRHPADDTILGRSEQEIGLPQHANRVFLAEPFPSDAEPLPHQGMPTLFSRQTMNGVESLTGYLDMRVYGYYNIRYK